MNIVILAGGTGSIALQTGLFELTKDFGDDLDIKVIVNAYDNGLSTGAVRKVLDGKILGPSDVRKNQTTRLKLENPKSPWNKFLDIRFTCESSKAQEYCHAQVKELEHSLKQDVSKIDSVSYPTPWQLVGEAIDEFFKSPNAAQIDYNDFSLANIVYAGFAKANKNSMREAAKVMASLMGIKDNVLVNDDTSLFLGAISKSGIRVSDESDIVSWGKVDDPFVDAFFTDARGAETEPVLNNESIEAILNADLIILSSGTQWSSLIPTYMSRGFKEAVAASSAKVLLVMNRIPDKDSPGQLASDIVDQLVPRFFAEDKLHIVLDNTSEKMGIVSSAAAKKLASVNAFDMRTADSHSKYDAHKLAAAIVQTYFRDYLNSDYFMFDYDDTLVGRGNSQLASSKANKELLNEIAQFAKVGICTGNSIKAINLCSTSALNNASLNVFADGGINLYEYTTKQLDDEESQATFKECIQQKALLSNANELVTALIQVGIPAHKIENRGNAMLSIKPIEKDYREIVVNLIKSIITSKDLVVKTAGRTTVEIMKAEVTKRHAVISVLQSSDVSSITYVGDELVDGNDSPVLELSKSNGNIKCLSVKGPAHTCLFLTALLHASGNV